jgi:hypothetical protein
VWLLQTEIGRAGRPIAQSQNPEVQPGDDVPEDIDGNTCGNLSYGAVLLKSGSAGISPLFHIRKVDEVLLACAFS